MKTCLGRRCDESSSGSPYLNYHRRCGFVTIQVLPRSRRKRSYPREDYHTPYEKLVSLPDWQWCLKKGTAQMLEQQARRVSDTDAAQPMQKAKLALLTNCRKAK